MFVLRGRDAPQKQRETTMTTENAFASPATIAAARKIRADYFRAAIETGTVREIREARRALLEVGMTESEIAAIAD